MIDLHERYIICNGQSFGERHSDEQGAEQAGPPGKGDGIEVGDTDRRVFKRRIHHGNDVLLMGTRGEFGNHAAVLHMHRLSSHDDSMPRITAPERDEFSKTCTFN